MPTFAEFFERWHKEIALRDCGRKTSERYDELGQCAIRLFGDVPLDGLTTQQLQTDVGRLLDHGGREYVPEVFAAMIIGYNQGKFKFGLRTQSKQCDASNSRWSRGAGCGIGLKGELLCHEVWYEGWRYDYGHGFGLVCFGKPMPIAGG